MYDCFNLSVRGNRHVLAGTVCQDYSLTLKTNDMHIATVCDGHGSSLHFRSDAGAKIAAETAVDCLKKFAETTDPSIFAGCAITPCGTCDRMGKLPEKASDAAIAQLIIDIHDTWHKRVREHALANPLTEQEEQRFLTDGEPLWSEDTRFDVFYGTTLLAALRTPNYWLTLQVGDGMTVAFDQEFNMYAPIPKDPTCQKNLTTSLCGKESANDFRSCYSGDPDALEAIFLTTDGMDKSFDTIRPYLKLLRGLHLTLLTQGSEKAHPLVEKILTDLSKESSQDDISVAAIFALD